MENIMRNQPVGKNYQVTIGDNATGVAVGERIQMQVNQPVTPLTERQWLTTLLADFEAVLAQTTRLLSPYEAHMALFHARLLRQELLKTETDGRPSADIMMMAGTWLLTRTPSLAGVLLPLFTSVPATAVINQAGEGMMKWVENRAAHYEVDGSPLNLVALRQVLSSLFDAGELRTLCFDMHIDFDDLYGEGKSDKARELVAYCVRHGRIAELAARCRELRPFAFVEN